MFYQPGEHIVNNIPAHCAKCLLLREFSTKDSSQRSPNSQELPPLVLIFHGMTGTTSEIEDLATSLHEHGMIVVAPLLSGHGISFQDFRRTTALTWLEDAEKVFALSKDHQGAIVLVGLSFGSLLALYLATKYPQKIDALVLLGPPLKLRDRLSEFGMNLLSYMPDFFLNTLGCWKKKKRKANCFAKPRIAFSMHSLAAAARLVWIRRKIMPGLKNVICPIFFAQDPDDHYLSTEGLDVLKGEVRDIEIESHWIPGGEHELTIGWEYAKVYHLISSFIKKSLFDFNS